MQKDSKPAVQWGSHNGSSLQFCAAFRRRRTHGTSKEKAPKIWLTKKLQRSGTAEGSRIPWATDLSPCSFPTAHFPSERSRSISLQLRDRPCDSFHSECIPPRHFATHEIEIVSLEFRPRTTPPFVRTEKKPKDKGFGLLGHQGPRRRATLESF